MVGREDRKEQIIDKAVGVFAERGYLGTWRLSPRE